MGETANGIAFSANAAADQPAPDELAPRVPRHRPLLWAAAAFAAGIVAARYLQLPLWPALAPGLLCAAIWAALHRRLRASIHAALVLVAAASAGAGTEAYHIAAVRASAERSVSRLLGPAPTLCTLSGTVTGEITTATIAPLIEIEDFEPRPVSILRVEASEVESNGRVQQVSGPVRVLIQRSPKGPAIELRHGDMISAFGWLAPLDPVTHRYAVSTGLVARMSVAGPDAVTLVRRGPPSLLRVFYGIKSALRDRVERWTEALSCLSKDAPTLLKALLLGDRGDIDGDLMVDFNKSGTTHFLAISGLHVGIVYAAAFWLCRMLLVRPWPRRTLCLATVIFYAAIAGPNPATVRATVMIVLFEAADALRFYRDSVSTVAAAALVILAAAPQHLFEAGFQLTFVAVLGIVLFSRDIARLIRRRRPGELERLAEARKTGRGRRLVRWLHKAAVAAVAVSVAATLAVAPLQAYYFNVVTPVSFLATAVLIPVITLFIAIGFVFLALASFVPVLAQFVAGTLSGLAMVFTSVVEGASRLPGGHTFVAAPPVWCVGLFYAALLVVAARRSLRLSGPRAAAVPVILWCLYAAWRLTLSPGPDLAATFLNVGHGECVVLTAGRETVVYDCGSGTPFSSYDVGREVAARELWRLGVNRIDVLILSHSDADHVNGVDSLLDRFPVGRIVVHDSFGRDERDEMGTYMLGVFDRYKIPVEHAAAGDRITLRGFDIEFLWPPKGESAWRLNAVNDRSLVARVRSGARTALLTGDIEKAGMGALLATQKDLHAELLCVPHHGAMEPVLREFLQAVRPGCAVISDEPRAPLDPKERASVRAMLGKSRVYYTSRDRTVRLQSTPDGWTVRTGK